MFVVPALTAVTNPVDKLTVATVVLKLLQLPLASPSLVKAALAPIQKSGDTPLTVPADTFGITVNVLYELTGLPQPLLTVYIIFVVPAFTAVANPVDELIVATDVLLLLQAPPVVPIGPSTIIE